jgi:hypothetical protein
MLTQLTIPKKNTQSLAMDYQQLYAIGLQHIQQLSSQIWTDYNVHDPGITTLELLCYALTDLSYRASFPIADLLASESNNAEEMKKQFFTARQILPNRPLTLSDYRKLLIDIKGVKNAWLQPAVLSYYADIVNLADSIDIFASPRIGYARLFTDEIIDLSSLARKLTNPANSDRVSQYINKKLSPQTLKALSAEPEASEDEKRSLTVMLVQDLNNIIQETIIRNGVIFGISLYDQQRFDGVRLSAPTRILLESKKRSEDIERLNRLLLEDVYTLEISQNQWLRNKSHLRELKKVNVAGLYKVKIEYENAQNLPEAEQNIRQAVQQKLQANRNLCEDFVQLTEIETQFFQLCAELELAPDADVTKVNAAILLQVQEYLSPSIRFYTLSQMLTRKKIDGTTYTVDEIFDGPVLDSGFIDDDELENTDLRTDIRLSDIISIIMDIKGVQAVRDIVINPEGNLIPLVNKWVIPVEVGKKPKLNFDQSRIVFYKRNLPVVPSGIEANPLTSRFTNNETNDLEIPLGQFRTPASYYSFQNHFPRIYGLSEIGLSSGADDKRKALADQLKAYLLFFDQIMANYFAQLSHVKELFSTDPNFHHTYFYQVVDSFIDYSRIYRSNLVIDDFIQIGAFTDKLKAHSDGVSLFLWSQLSGETQQAIAGYTGEEMQIQPLKTALANELNQIIKASLIYDLPRFENIPLAEETQKLLHRPTQDDEMVLLNRLLLQDAYPQEIAKWNEEEKTGFADRRNRFLDHLIARFAEGVHDLAYTMYSNFGAGSEDMIRYKCQFLESYPTISSDRSLAYNYSLTDDKDLWDSENISGLEKRLAKLLGIADHRRQDLAHIDYEIVTATATEFGFEIINKDTSAAILRSTKLYSDRKTVTEAIKAAIHFGIERQHYQKNTTDEKHYFSIIDNTAQQIARSFNDFDTEGEMNEAIETVITYFNSSVEGMYLIENILLQPILSTDPFLPICPNPNCNDCAEVDPYSYRIHIILPAYGPRFGKIEFRRFAEAVIREETPAHILPKVCWINKEDMTVLEKLYRDWIYPKVGLDQTERQEKLKQFIQELFTVKNVYPQQKLSDFDSREDQPKFILGQTALGTQKPKT